MKRYKQKLQAIILSLILCCSLITGCSNNISQHLNDKYTNTESSTSFDLSQIPDYSGNPIYIYNNNTPLFTESEITTVAFEDYKDLDSIGRVQAATACLGEETLPTTPRGDISSVKPTGWHSVKYDCVDQLYLYNRCHLIAHELSGEDANERNLATGTRYMNVQGMLPYENMTREYIDDTGNHVMYRATPIFIDNELVCRGILLEGLSVEDNGTGIQFCIYCYNVQPGVIINYATGDSQQDTTNPDENAPSETKTYILNTKSKIIHLPECSSVSKMSEANKQEYTGSLSEKLNEGYTTCGACKPQ